MLNIFHRGSYNEDLEDDFESLESYNILGRPLSSRQITAESSEPRINDRIPGQRISLHPSEMNTVNEVFKQSFREILIALGVCVLINYTTLIITSIRYSAVSIGSFLVCLLLSIGLCSLQGKSIALEQNPQLSSFSIKERQINVFILIVLYLVTFFSFADQGICNIKQVLCPYVNRDINRMLNPPDSESKPTDIEIVEFLKDEFQLGIILLASLGLSFVINAFMVMRAVSMLSMQTFHQVRSPVNRPNSPLKQRAKDIYKVKNSFALKECLICQQCFKPTDKVHILACRHIFHAPCFQTWFKKSRSCPICREIVINVNNEDFKVEYDGFDV